MCGIKSEKLQVGWLCANGHVTDWAPAMIDDAAMHLAWKFVECRNYRQDRSTVAGFYGFDLMGRTVAAMMPTHSPTFRLVRCQHDGPEEDDECECECVWTDDQYECEWKNYDGVPCGAFVASDLSTAVVVAAARATRWAWQEAKQ